MLAAHNTGYEFLNGSQEVTNEMPRGDNKRHRAIKRGLATRRNEMIVRFSKKIVETDLPQLVLVQVVPDLNEHGIKT